MTSHRAARPLRIAQVAPPLERVPPAAYGGTERVVDELARELAARGHQITLFASADSESPGRLIPTVGAPLRMSGSDTELSALQAETIRLVLAHEREFDVVHAHLDFWNIVLARAACGPVIGTFHGRLDFPDADRVIAGDPDPVPNLVPVALSHAHAAQAPRVTWSVVYNGLSLSGMPFGATPSEDLCFVGRMAADKGVVDAVQIASAAGRRLRIAAKEPVLPVERDYYEAVFKPAAAAADVELLGELGPADRDALLADSYATLIPSVWPEPFGLVAIESLACGTPVVARAIGALPEIVRHGVDGFLADDVPRMAALVDRVSGLDRVRVRRDVLGRFSAARMADGYEALYRRALRGR